MAPLPSRPAPRPRRSVSIVARHLVTLLLFLLGDPTSLIQAAGPTPGPTLRRVRSFPLGEADAAPTRLTYDELADAFVLVQDAPAGGCQLVAVSRSEDPAGDSPLATGLALPRAAAFDTATGSICLLAVGPTELVEVALQPGGGLPPRGVGRRELTHRGLQDPRGLARDPATGEVFVLEGRPAPRLLRLVPSNPASLADTLDLGAMTGAALPELLADARGLAFDPSSHRLYTLVDAGTRLVALTRDGELVTVADLSPFALSGPRDLVVAPDADPTNAPRRTSVYVLDERADGTLWLVELAPVDPAEHEAGEAAQAAVGGTQATLIRTIHTSAFDPPSPDPAGITYITTQGRLLVSDSEVNETPLFGANLFAMTLAGEQREIGDSLEWSEEPTGLSHHPGRGSVFVTDDDNDLVYEVHPGADATWGTTDDDVTSFDTRGFGSQDPEGVCYDPDNDQLFVVDGEGSEVYRLLPGPNGLFDGLDGDDVVSSFDILSLGALDPEGIAYNPAAGTLFISDSDDAQVLEVTTSGVLVRVIDLSAVDPDNAAGVVYAPASNDASLLHLYVVDRGLDNDGHPGENDGRCYELSIGDPPLGNAPPVVDAGSDQVILVTDGAVLTGSVADDGLPLLPGQTTSAWSQLSGPALVTFADASQTATVVSFEAGGIYVLRLTADDGHLAASDDVTIEALAGGDVIDRRIRASADDAEERWNGAVNLTSPDLDLVKQGNSDQVIGLRFPALGIPQGARVLTASVQFQADETGSTTTTLRIRAQSSDDAPPFVDSGHDVSGRPTTVAAVDWVPPPWTAIGDHGFAQQTPDLAPLIQEVVDRPGWAFGNALALIIDGSGHRAAESYDAFPSAAAWLHVELEREEPNEPPVVDAGPDQTISLPAVAVLSGVVVDDGPDSPTLAWSQVDGPGAAVFEDPGAASTTIAFPAAGLYLLRLTADDGELSASDDVHIDVLAGDASWIESRVSASADDAEEQPDGSVILSSNELELVTVGPDDQTVGLRFDDLAIPRGATIRSAHVQFRADEVSTDDASLTIAGQATDDASPFTEADGDVSSRPTTSASVGWPPPPWPTVGEQGLPQRTPDLAAILQEIVDRPGWTSGNALALIVTGSGRRTAASFEGGATFAPLLQVEFDEPDLPDDPGAWNPPMGGGKRGTLGPPPGGQSL